MKCAFYPMKAQTGISPTVLQNLFWVIINCCFWSQRIMIILHVKINSFIEQLLFLWQGKDRFIDTYKVKKVNLPHLIWETMIYQEWECDQMDWQFLKWDVPKARKLKEVSSLNSRRNIPNQSWARKPYLHKPQNADLYRGPWFQLQNSWFLLVHTSSKVDLCPASNYRKGYDKGSLPILKI